MTEHKTVELMEWLRENRPSLFEAFWSEPDEQPHRVLNAATGLDIGPTSGIDVADACGQWLAALQGQH